MDSTYTRLSGIRRRAAGMTLDQVKQAARSASEEASLRSDYRETLYDQNMYAEAEEAFNEWRRIGALMTEARLSVYDPKRDRVGEKRDREEAARAEDADYRAVPRANSTPAMPAQPVQPVLSDTPVPGDLGKRETLLVALAQAGLTFQLDEADRQVVEQLVTMDQRVVSQVASWIVRTRAQALRNDG